MTPEKPPPVPEGIPPHVVVLVEGLRISALRHRREMQEGHEKAIADLAAQRKAA